MVLFVNVGQCYYFDKNPFKEFPSTHKFTLFWRCLLGGLTFFLFNLSLLFVPVYLTTIIFQSSCFWISILGYFVNNEKMLSAEVLSLLICFSCMAIMVTQGATEPVEDGELVPSATAGSLQTLGIALCVITSWVYAGSAVLNRKLKDFHWVIITTYYGLMGLTLGIVLVLAAPLFNDQITTYWEGITFFSYSSKLYWTMIVAVALDSIAVNCVIIAFQSDSGGFVSLISYISIFYAFAGDLIIFKETFTARELICSTTILAVIVTISVVKLRAKNKEQAKLSPQQRQRLNSHDSFASSFH